MPQPFCVVGVVPKGKKKNKLLIIIKKTTLVGLCPTSKAHAVYGMHQDRAVYLIKIQYEEEEKLLVSLIVPKTVFRWY